jgi:genome maintenance exonuclease 1
LKTFIYHDIPKLVQINSNGGRVYQTPTGEKYPSVTTILGAFSAKSIKEWRSRVGDEEANKISARAAKRGTATHTLCENYLLGKPNNIDIFDQEMFNTLVPHLNLIDNIHCLEGKLFSHKLKAAGTVDCIGEYNGKLSVIDFKSSKRVKKKEWISNYFMQCASYGMMFWEHTKIPIDTLTVIMGVDDHDAIVFQEPLKPWLEQFRKVRLDYFLYKGI